MAWQDIQAIAVETNDLGPCQEDVYVILFSETEKESLSIPHCAEGFNALLERFGQFQGFDWKAFTAAMACTSNRSFPCWQKKDAPAKTGREL